MARRVCVEQTGLRSTLTPGVDVREGVLPRMKTLDNQGWDNFQGCQAKRMEMGHEMRKRGPEGSGEKEYKVRYVGH